MPQGIHSRGWLQMMLALLAGTAFGFFLQKGGVSEYEVVIGQLRFTDNTVLKMMLSAVAAGMAGIHALRSRGLVRFHPKSGSLGSLIPGGILFGAGFALLGYCPGTLVAAAGQGNLDAALAGIPGMLTGAWIYAVAYPALSRGVLLKGNLGDRSVPEILRLPPAIIVPAAIAVLVVFLFFLERAGG